MQRTALSALILTLMASSTKAQARDTVIDKIFESYRGTDGPGCAVAVSRNGRIVHERGYGMANLETGTPISPGSIFHVASVSKQFTAAAILLLEKDGRLSLDDDIRKHLPEIPDYGARITIRHLLNHTSGLRDQWDLLAMARGRFEENRITEADVMQIVPRQTSLNFPPGSEYMYSNTGYTLAGVIVKRVSGKSLRQFADERIFRPLGMANTHFHDDFTMIVPGRTMAYASRQGGGMRVSIPNYDTYGATSLFTTVGDLLKWEWNRDSLEVGDRALFERMETSGRLTNGDSTGYGLGVQVGPYRGARLVEHSGGDAGYRSWLGRFPEHGLAIAIACNGGTTIPVLLGRRIADAHLASVLAAAPPEVAPQGTPVSPADLQKRAGVYFLPLTLQVNELTIRDGRLFLGRTGSTELVAVAANRFKTSAQGGEYTFDDGERAGFTFRSSATGRSVRFERKDPMTATRAAMQPYTGEYFSAELGATYRVVATDSSITLQTGTSEPFNERPVFTDAFVGRYLVQFTRSGGRITGFEISSGRVRRVRFDKK